MLFEHTKIAVEMSRSDRPKRSESSLADFVSSSLKLNKIDVWRKSTIRLEIEKQ